MKIKQTFLLASSILFFSIVCLGQDTKPAGGVQSQSSKYRLTKAVTGTKGSEQSGRFILDDPRSTFYIPQDKKIIAYFEWDGPIGIHTIEATWKRPSGKVGSVDEFKYDAKT